MLAKLALVFFTVLYLTSPSLAESVSADSLIVSTPNYSPEFSEFKPSLGTYEYDVSWGGIPAATIFLDVHKKGLNYHISTRVKSVRAIDLFYKLRYEANGIISAVDLMPIKTSIDSQENSKVKVTSLNFQPNGVVKSFHRVNQREPVQYEFDPDNAMLDPFSAAFLARSLSWKEGDTKHFDTFNGKSRYLISLTAREKLEMDINGTKRNVVVVVPSVKKLNADKNHKSKLRSAEIYVTDDERREILKIRSEVFIGHVNTELVSFRPDPVVGTTLAKVIEYDIP